MILSADRRPSKRVSSLVLLAGLCGLAVPAAGQEVPPAPVDPYGQFDPSGQPVAAPVFSPPQPQPQPQPQPSGAGAVPSMKQIFAGTLATVVQVYGGALLGGIAQVITGRLVDWFGRKLESPAAPASGLAPDAEVGGAPAAQLLDPGQAVPQPMPPGAPVASPDGIAAGLAFEVHRLGPGGTTTFVDPAAPDFRTGERFVVFFRPSLPGRMEIYNINPAGQQQLIDTQELAAGQLTRLGPYEFTAMTGDEQLRLVMQPCSSPALTSATRDIVRVPDAIPAESGLALPGCAMLPSPSAGTVPTRDIRKVSVEDGTSFALDRVSGEELASGQVAPREVTLRFRHF